MQFHTLESGQKLAWTRGNKTIGLGSCYVLPVGRPEMRSFEGEDHKETVAWYNDLMTREDVIGFDFPNHVSDSEVIEIAKTGNYI
jgi:hypothetical protein